MKMNLVKEMNFNQVAKYKRPCIITMTGLPGSGKTTLAQELSRKLRIYLLSNDYIRNYYHLLTNDCSEKQEIYIQSIVEETNIKRLSKLLLHRISFIFDRDFNSKDQIDKFILLSKILKFELIKIRICSNEKNNINRISNRILNFDAKDESIIGDNVSYSSPFSEDSYYQIVKRKPQILNNVEFDYTINNFEGLQEFMQNADQIVEEIISNKLILKK